VSVHFNGWGNYPNPHNYTTNKIHAYFEGEFVRRNINSADVAAAVKPFAPCGCPVEERTRKYLFATQARVNQLYDLEKAGAFQGGNASGRSFVAERLADGVSELRDLIVEAWRGSADVSVGYPAVSVHDAEDGKPVNWSGLAGLD
jgi:carboxypeptidase C (cathepsin A)